MNRRETLVWLAEFQAGFGAALYTPLDPTGGTLHADLKRYPAAICSRVSAGSLSAADRLAVYNRQFWMRLLRGLQNELPLTSRLCGLWSFNQLAMKFLQAYPPDNHELSSICERFDQFIADTLPAEVPCVEGGAVLPRLALHQAARIDLAFRRVFLAPKQPEFRLSGDEDLDRIQLCASVSHARIVEHWPLVDTRTQARAPDAPHVLPLREPLAAPRTWALFRTSRGVGQLTLEPEHARLLDLFETRSVGAALALLESETASGERDALPRRVQRWLAQSAELGFFSGFERLSTLGRVPQL